jgi:hypothetical protein
VHPIVVVNEAPLSNILNNPSATGRVSLWGIELSPLDITYKERKEIKSQVLPDFTAEWLELQNTGPPDLSSVWTMYFDGSKRVQGAGAGVVLLSPLLKCISELPSPFHQFGLLVALVSA